MSKTLRTIVLATILLSMATVGFSVVSTLSLKGGTAYPLTDINGDAQYKPMLGMSYEMWYKNMLSLGISPYLSKLEATENGGKFTSNIVGADMMLKLRPNCKMANLYFKDAAVKRIAPFINAGVGIVNFYPKDGNGVYVPGFDHTTTVLPAVGGGLSFFFDNDINLDLGFQRQSAGSDYLDGVKWNKGKDAFWMSYLGIGYSFGVKHKKAPKVEFSKDQSLILNGVNFELDSDALTSTALPILDEVVESLQYYPEVELEVQGHTDITGSLEHNNDLSLRRAQSVKNYLVSKGIDESRLTVAGFGPSRPIAPNNTPEGQAQNRRIEFVRTK